MKICGCVLLAVLSFSFPACDNSDAGLGPMAIRTFPMAPANNSGVTGDLIITDLVRPTSSVEVELKGLMPGQRYIGHIHLGTTCGSNGPVVRELATITADATGRGDITTRDVSDEEVTATHYVDYHADANGETGTAVACGEIE